MTAQTDGEAGTFTEERVRDLLAGRYRITRKVGTGGTGVVFEGYSETTGAHVAVKVLRSDVSSALGPERFVREIRIAGSLKHPGIVPVAEFGDASGVLYYTMPFIDGESLRDRIQREGSLPIDDTRAIVRQVAAALQAAHQAGVVHRDIKPGNILLSGDRALLTDFGLARILTESVGDRITSSGLVVGTPAYMSPEQGGGQGRVDHRTDIYSLGITVYEMLVGEPPFTGPTIQAVVARHMHERPPSIAIVRPSVPTEITETLEIALAKNPADRFSSAEAMARAMENRGVEWRVRRALRRNRTRLAVFTLAIIALVAYRLIPRGPPLLAHRVVVFPFEATGREREAGEDGWLAALAVEGALEHSEPLRWIDGRSHLEQGDAGRPQAAVQRRITRARGARYYLNGVIRDAEGGVSVTVRIHDVVADSLLGQETVTSPTLETATLNAAVALLPRLVDPTRRVDLSALIERRPQAIALWIQGEREYRRSQFGTALQFYRRALDADSALSIAAVKGAQAAAWMEQAVEARQLASVGARRAAPLPPRLRAFITGLDAFYRSQADSAEWLIREARRLDPESAEAAMAYGEVHRHLLPPTAAPDSVAEASFASAMRLDSAFTPPLIHLIEYAVRRGDLASAASMQDRLTRSGADSTGMVRVLHLMSGCVRAGWGQSHWNDALARHGRVIVLGAARQLGVGGRQPECATGAYQVLLADSGDGPHRWSAFMGLEAIRASQGRASEVNSLLDSALAISQWAIALGILNGIAGLPADVWTTRADSIVRERYGEYYERVPIAQLRWVMSLVAAGNGDAVRLDTLVRRQREALLPGGTAKDTLLSLAMKGHLDLVRHDTAQAIRTFTDLLHRALPRDSISFGIPDALPVERLILSRLYFAQGRYSDAFKAAQVFDHEEPLVFQAFVGASLRLRRASAERLGLNGTVRELDRRLQLLSQQ